MGWYDTFATFYDDTLERLYLPHRRLSVDALHLEPDSVVLDLACGTGANLPALFEGRGPARVVGVDASKGMLARAEARAEQLGVADRTAFLCVDARELTAGALVDAAGGAPDRLICTLGLSVIPDHEAVLAATLDRLAAGARVVLYDVVAESWVPQTTMVQWMARADLSRRSWEALEPRVESLDHRFLDGSVHVYGGRPWLAAGRLAGNPSRAAGVGEGTDRGVS